jgi:octaheme c-type cytochrome (tetrathionate reductase family)
MKTFKYIWLVGLTVTLLAVVVPIAAFVRQEAKPADDPWSFVPSRVPDTDHTNLLAGPFATGSDVTRACLECHETAAHEVAQTIHWTWESEPVLLPGRDEPVTIGKKNQINNYCIGIQGNWTGCTSCHAGYGWEDASFDFTAEENVDCLVCHADTGLYSKDTAGLPTEGVDLIAAAQSVGTPSRQNCGTCHFSGGGGNAVKHGDLDQSLNFPTADVDVHMGELDFQCVDCHQAQEHQIPGQMISISTRTGTNLACQSCHSNAVHQDERITGHLDTVACQTCHIPYGAVRDATKMYWDWSTAGQDWPEDPHVYLKIKGSFIYESNFVPEYAWFNGQADRYLLGDPMDPNQITVLNQPLGDINDANARIYPFKIHNANQIYDAGYNYLLQPLTAGEGGYWTTFDWQSAAELGAAATGMEYSGEYGFAPTQMYWLLTHMVAPKENSLQCQDCHEANGRLDWQALVYPGDPMEWGGR